MIKIEKNISKIKDSNLIFLFENKSDLKYLDSLNIFPESINKNIINKINSTFSDGKNTSLDFFIGSKNFENITIIFYIDTSSSLLEYASDIFRGYKNNKFSIYSRNEEYLLKMIDMSLLARYKYDKYKTELDSENNDIINIILEDNTYESLYKDLESRISTIENIIYARDLGNMPPNELYPETFSKIVKSTSFKNTKVKIFDYKKIDKLGLGLLKAVGKGSIHKPNMVILERIINKSLPTIGIVGKGVTFDTGGIQVKPGDSMYEMKGDMCGAAQVFSIMKELDQKDLNVNIVGCLVLAENHISGESYKPSDIIKSYSGKTVNVIHTDAEGRLILADGISYISKNYNLEKIISVATLTGACMVALGFRYAGIMGNDDNLISNFIKYSEKNQEKYNILPFDNYFKEKTKSEVADLENLNRGVYAGATMGAAFLGNFVLNNEKYTHIDIAGPALNFFEHYGVANKGITGFGVDSISSIIKNLK